MLKLVILCLVLKNIIKIIILIYNNINQKKVVTAVAMKIIITIYNKKKIIFLRQ